MRNPIRDTRFPDISGADNPVQLRSVREKEQLRLEEAMASAPADQIYATLNELHDALIDRALKLAENDLARSGHGAPPVPYAYLLFGSAGRFEQTMHSDQDSGLVYADAPEGTNEERHRDYYLRLAETAVRHLVAIGYPPCDGNVISSNPDWCLPLAGWTAKIERWFAEPSWENVRYLLIAADGRPVSGDRDMAERLRDRYFGDMLENPVIARRMLENTLRHKVLVGVFGQLLTERYGEESGSLDIKYGAYIPMVNTFRLLSMQSGIRETSTLARIDALRLAGILTAEEAAEAAEAFALFLQLRLQTSVTAEDGHLVGTGKIPSGKLTKEIVAPLKKALKTGRKFQRKVEKELQHRFGGR
ncbi:DUF294 nucleotidyltransferase-like domain-containing protein [Paenibacillaceae bacterium WGS1546]|uniref:DUF294 nucleotidyltransferase-like domain-containing protein n=1 Tax=Cohnella sp. WGS1546 TaxID=3366810 RepID=UPI00372D2081